MTQGGGPWSSFYSGSPYIYYRTFDFIVHNIEYTFLKCNTEGQWVWLDRMCNGKISSAYADMFADLIGSDNEKESDNV